MTDTNIPITMMTTKLSLKNPIAYFLTSKITISHSNTFQQPRCYENNCAATAFEKAEYATELMSMLV